MIERLSSRKLNKLDVLIESMLRMARVPGGGVAVVAGGSTVYAKGFGHRDLRRKKPVTPATVYPIASTTKAMNATLLGMLVDEGRLEWDAPVTRYLPQFQLRDRAISSRVTIRDLLTMRIGLPRHDWVWAGSSESRAELVRRLAYLEPSADFRQRFQYCNLSVTAAGHIAEAITGRSWERLVRERIFRPLRMHRTGCARPKDDELTLSYHENAHRKIVRSPYSTSSATAPSGGLVHSTIADMARWMLFNLRRGTLYRRRLIEAETLAQIHSPQVVVGERPLATLPHDATYALGWLVDSYNGHKRLSHAGYLCDIHSSVMLFPDADVGIVSFVNFGSPLVADLINQHVFDTVLGLKAIHGLEQRLARYEAGIVTTCKLRAEAAHVRNTRASRPLEEYLGKYRNAGYGEIGIHRRGSQLVLRRYNASVRLKHWHYDVWVADDSNRWPIHVSCTFDPLAPLQFHLDVRGAVAQLSVPMEPELAPIVFDKQR